MDTQFSVNIGTSHNSYYIAVSQENLTLIITIVITIVFCTCSHLHYNAAQAQNSFILLLPCLFANTSTKSSSLMARALSDSTLKTPKLLSLSSLMVLLR